jgi:hypothetical protein
MLSVGRCSHFFEDVPQRQQLGLQAIFITECFGLCHLEPRCWFRYIDGIVVIWPHGPSRLEDFLHHLKSIQQSIHFIM